MESRSVSYQTGVQELGAGPFSETPPGIDRLADGIRALERWYSVDFERRVTGLAEVLKSQITEETRAHFSAEMNDRLDRTRLEYEERLSNQARQWNAQRQLMENELEDLRRKVPSNDVMNEIAATEAIVSISMERGREFERVAPDAASLGRIFQARVEELEAKAYLRGLKFRLPENL